ncbi:hypothetical protein AOL_s00043g336 [Orbilia oligospora ATCC 24927]|uniref:Uncharacterized protein n=2 Tax=Orbilia oligospora TaxID=2813651 RepID=G1X3R2_ARTOA|nr:hypothetical protein AOL_s00043g336 [Orbilia oligospora ATCC 24927]EGX52193.1 hypothetical protein AOL_s00043g336 [Orbilia oligospora ATCC 24927]KAF3289427.1 hypothetical protein TWF970_003206 [Orbilia oligospora]
MHRSSHSSSHHSGSSSSGGSHHYNYGHQTEYHSSHSQRRDKYSITSGLSEQIRDIRGYVVDAHLDQYPRSMVQEPMLTSASLGIRVEPLYPDTQHELERELTPRFRLREEVIYANDIFEVVTKPKLVRADRHETFIYKIRHKHDKDLVSEEILEEHLIRIPRRRFETGAIVRLERDGKQYEVLHAEFLPQEFVWDYKIKRFSSSGGGDIKRNAFEGRLSRVDSSDSSRSNSSYLTPPSSRSSPPKVSPKGSFSSLFESLMRH